LRKVFFSYYIYDTFLLKIYLNRIFERMALAHLLKAQLNFFFVRVSLLTGMNIKMTNKY